jgi:3-dehydrosphinganine reductase
MAVHRNIVITGGSSGLGLALARACVRRGDRVVLLARDLGKLDSAAAELRALTQGATVLVAAVDVQNPAGLRHAFDAIANELGGIDVLVNCAGILREGYFESLSAHVHREVMDINYFGTLNTIQAALPQLKQAARPRIVNIASIAGLTGVFGYSAYCASKHALVGLSEVLRYELAPQGITVQLVCPPEFDSPMVDALDRTRTPENREHTLTIPKVSVEVIVADVLRAMDHHRFLIIPGRLARLTSLGLRHFPAISRLIGDTRVRKAYVGPVSQTP